MQQIQQKIELFHNLSLMCMLLFLVCLFHNTLLCNVMLQ